MDLVSNYTGIISPSQVMGTPQGITQSLDMEDGTFADLLAKQMENDTQNNINMIHNSIQIPSGLNIGDFDGVNPVFNSNDISPVNKINDTQETGMLDFKNIKDMTTSEVLTFVTSLFDNKPNMAQNDNDNGLFSFERKLAASTYGKYAKGLVTDLQDFVSDALKLS